MGRREVERNPASEAPGTAGGAWPHPAIMHRVATPPLATIGVDLGGSNVRAAVVTPDGSILRIHEWLTQPERGPEAVPDDLVGCIREACLADAGDRVLGVGVGVAGQVDLATGMVRHAPNLDWHDVPLRVRLEEALRLPVAVLNDVQAAAFGEHMFGAGQGVSELVCLFLGTGVGGGVITRGRLLQGCTGSAAELGHITVDPNGPLCRCGNRGCLEAFAGGWAIARRAREAATAAPESGPILRELAGGDLERIATSTVVEAAGRGDPISQRILGEASQALWIGVASIVNAFNPCVVVLGGGVVVGLPEWIEAARQGVRSRSLAANAAAVRVVTAGLGTRAGTIGAAAWAAAVVGETHDRPPS